MMSNEEKFLLKWNNHQSNLIDVFKEWLHDESFVDITLVCGGEAVSGHKVVLAACSPLLNRILHDNPCRHPVVILNDVCSTDMRALLKFIYHGEVSVSQSDLPSFLRTADNLQIKGLAEDKEKEDKKRKEKTETHHGGVRKKRRTELKVSSSHSSSRSCNQTNADSQSSSPKSQKHFSPHREKFSSFNSYQTHGGVKSNSVKNQTIPYSLESELDQAAEQGYLKENLVVKTEPLDYPGEVVWQEGNSIVNKENASKDNCENINSNASGGNNYQHSPSGSLQFNVLPPSLDNFGTGSSTEFLQRNLNSLSSGEKQLEEDVKANDEHSQSSLVAGLKRYSSPGWNDFGSLVEEQPCFNEEKPVNSHLTSSSSSIPSDPPTTTTSSVTVASSLAGLSVMCDSQQNETSSSDALSPPSSSSNLAYFSMNGTLLSCTNCSFRSRNPYTFNRHLRIHFDEKEFKCTSCSYASNRNDSLIRHYRMKHQIHNRLWPISGGDQL